MKQEKTKMEERKLREDIYEAALPLLEGRTVTDVVVGLSMLGVELDNEAISVGYTVRENLGGGCSIFPYVQSLTGMKAEEAAKWFVDGKDDVQRGIGAAIINCASQKLELEDSDSDEHPFGLTLTPADTVGMAGMIRPAIMRMKKFQPKFMIFDKGKCSSGNAEEDIYPMALQEELLPKCTVMTMSGTSLVNGTAAGLFRMSPNARETVLIGASTPMIPDGYRNTPVTVLAGSWWRYEDKPVIWKMITQAAGLKVLGRYMVKKNVRLK